MNRWTKRCMAFVLTLTIMCTSMSAVKPTVETTYAATVQNITKSAKVVCRKTVAVKAPSGYKNCKYSSTNPKVTIKAWFDFEGNFCIEYESGKWWHYNDKGEWWQLKVGKYQIGRFHAIIRKEYADGSVDYETSFTDIEDFNESYYCILKCIGKEVGIATDNPKVLTYACVIRGKEEIEKELLHGNGKQLEYI